MAPIALRRSHYLHICFKMVKRWSNIGTHVGNWAKIHQTLFKHWSEIGTHIGKWSNHGQTLVKHCYTCWELVKHWSNIGTHVGKWSNHGQTLVNHWYTCRKMVKPLSNTGQTLVHMPGNGQTLVKHWSNIGHPVRTWSGTGQTWVRHCRACPEVLGSQHDVVLTMVRPPVIIGTNWGPWLDLLFSHAQFWYHGLTSCFGAHHLGPWFDQ